MVSMNVNMDSLVSKLRQTVSQVAHQVNNSVNTIIPGNAIHREYEIFKLRCTHGCPKFVWTVHDAMKRDSSSIKASLRDAIGPNLMSLPGVGDSNSNSRVPHAEVPNSNDNKQLYSVFLFDKKQLDYIPNKASRELALDHIRRGVTQLTRLRHPSILTVHHPMEESRSSIAFVTEHVYGHLGSILKEQQVRGQDSIGKSALSTNLVDLSTDLGPKDSDFQNDSCQLDAIQIKAGLLQICDGLEFLHNDAKMLHRNICLDNIFVDSNNTWKISGFDFSCSQVTAPTDSVRPMDSNNELQIVEFNPKPTNSQMFPSLRTINQQLSTYIVPNWSCSAPEHSNADQVTSSSDIYSLGVLSCALLGSNTDSIDLSYEYGLISDTYKRGILCRELADRLPTSIKSSIFKFAALNDTSRPSLEDFKNLNVFQDPQVQSIRDLDSQFAWDRLKKIDFFNRLRDILPGLSHQVKVNRIAKTLYNEAFNTDMLPYIIPNIMIIAKDCTPTEFKTKIFPGLKGPFRILEPKAVPLMLLDNLPLLADRSKLCLSEFQTSAFTLIQYLLRMDQQMQEKCFVVLPKVKRYIDNPAMTQILLPEINKVCHATNSLQVRAKCINCIRDMVDSMESSTIINYVLPIIYSIPSRETDVIMATIALVKAIINDSQAELTKDIIAGRLVPFLVPLMVERELSLQQFEVIVTLIRNLVERVERAQREILARRHQVASESGAGGLNRSNKLMLEL